jgi:small subunit ribosomal protein S1
MYRMETTPRPASAMDALLADGQPQPQLPEVDEIIDGMVLSVSKTEVIVDIGGIATGVVRGRELYDESGDFANVKIGDGIQATVLDIENERGLYELSFRAAGHRKAWDELQKFVREKTVIDAPVLDANRGGLLMKVGRIEGFLPVSQLSPDHYPRVEGGERTRIVDTLGKLVGTELKVRVIDVDETENRLIVSEKAAREAEQEERLKNYKVGDNVEGVVSGIVSFGVFLAFGDGLEGLIHISELSWQRIDDPKKLAEMGQKMTAQIIGIEGSKISLSLKRLLEDPWVKAAERYPVGSKVKAKVLRLNTFGAFCELDPVIQGLCHISELAYKTPRHPSDVVKVGEEREFKVISLDVAQHRLGLSIKQLEEEPTKRASSDPALAAFEAEMEALAGKGEESKSKEF